MVVTRNLVQRTAKLKLHYTTAVAVENSQTVRHVAVSGADNNLQAVLHNVLTDGSKRSRSLHECIVHALDFSEYRKPALIALMNEYGIPVIGSATRQQLVSYIADNFATIVVTKRVTRHTIA